MGDFATQCPGGGVAVPVAGTTDGDVLADADADAGAAPRRPVARQAAVTKITLRREDAAFFMIFFCFLIKEEGNSPQRMPQHPYKR